CAEGIVAAELARAGAKTVHAFELNEERVEDARELLSTFRAMHTEVRRADLANWDAFTRDHYDVLLPRYDVVLFLGLLHHLREATRQRALTGAMARAGRWFALRTPAEPRTVEALVARCRREGLWLVHTSEAAGDLGWLGLFRRATASVLPQSLGVVRGGDS